MAVVWPVTQNMSSVGQNVKTTQKKGLKENLSHVRKEIRSVIIILFNERKFHYILCFCNKYK